jgi:shikimate kinase
VARVLETPLADLVKPLDEAARAREGGDEDRHPRIALVGLRGAGKSTIGKRTADKLGVPFLELDQEIEKSAGMPLPQIFEIYGDTYFRRLERDVLAQILKRTEHGVVIATGGGIVMDAESWQLLKRSTRTIWLKAKPEDHYRRVMAQGDTRPMKNRPAAMSELRALLTSARRALRRSGHDRRHERPRPGGLGRGHRAVGARRGARRARWWWPLRGSLRMRSGARVPMSERGSRASGPAGP